MADLGSISREFVEMIDERLNRPVGEWTPGTWVFGIITLGTIAFFLSLTWEFLIVPAWHVAVWINDGQALQALHTLNGSTIFQTLVFLGVVVFIVLSGAACVDGAVRLIFWIRGQQGGLRQQLFEELRPLTPLKKAVFLTMMVFVVLFIASFYFLAVYFALHMYNQGPQS